MHPQGLLILLMVAVNECPGIYRVHLNLAYFCCI